MDTQIIAYGFILAGVLCGVVIPALIAMHERGETFKMSYLYGTTISAAVGAFAVLPTDEISLTFRSLFMLFLAGVGLQGIVNKGNTIRIKHLKG